MEDEGFPDLGGFLVCSILLMGGVLGALAGTLLTLLTVWLV